jgi:hypothetical protein
MKVTKAIAEDFFNVHTVSDWESPATPYSAMKAGRAEIRKYKSGRGYYFAEGVRGHMFFRHKKPAVMTTLHIDGRVWMTDDPQYVWCLESFAERSTGNVLVAGLGLGMVVHFLTQNPLVSRITVVDCEPDVVHLVQPLLPKDPRIQIVTADFYHFLFNLDQEKRDTVIWDLGLWSGNEQGEGRGWISTIKPICLNKYGPETLVFRHGLDRDPVGDAFIKKHRSLYHDTRELMMKRGL